MCWLLAIYLINWFSSAPILPFALAFYSNKQVVSTLSSIFYFMWAPPYWTFFQWFLFSIQKEVFPPDLCTHFKTIPSMLGIVSFGLMCLGLLYVTSSYHKYLLMKTFHFLYLSAYLLKFCLEHSSVKSGYTLSIGKEWRWWMMWKHCSVNDQEIYRHCTFHPSL